MWAGHSDIGVFGGWGGRFNKVLSAFKLILAAIAERGIPVSS